MENRSKPGRRGGLDQAEASTTVCSAAHGRDPTGHRIPLVRTSSLQLALQFMNILAVRLLRSSAHRQATRVEAHRQHPCPRKIPALVFLVTAAGYRPTRTGARPWSSYVFAWIVAACTAGLVASNCTPATRSNIRTTVMAVIGAETMAQIYQ